MSSGRTRTFLPPRIKRQGWLHLTEHGRLHFGERYRAVKAMDAGNNGDAKRLLILTANSLSAFAEYQAHFDELEIGKTNVPIEIEA